MGLTKLEPIIYLILLLTATVLLTIAISIPLYRFVETPGVKLGKKIIGKNNRRTSSEKVKQVAQ